VAKQNGKPKKKKKKKKKNKKKKTPEEMYVKVISPGGQVGGADGGEGYM
jgi:hypothetical protein